MKAKRKMRVYVSPPYDVGFPHILSGALGGKVVSAVISAEAAEYLIAAGIPEKAPGREAPETVAKLPIRLSKKAKELLGISD